MAAEDQPPRFLLLLPPLQTTVSYSNLSRTYGPPLSAALHAVATTPNESTRPAILEIALACRDLGVDSLLPRSQLFGRIQSRLASVYKLICVICADHDIDTAGPGGVDARILTLAWNGDEDKIHVKEPDGTVEDNQGIVVDLATLAVSVRPWLTVFIVDDDGPGEYMRYQFDALSCRLLPKGTPAWKFKRVPRGKYTDDLNDPAPTMSRDAKHKSHYEVAVGGTFDHLHAGHKLLLTMTAFLVQPVDDTDEQLPRMTVGISGDALLQNKAFAEYMCPWDERQRDVFDFISAIADFWPPHWAAQREVTEGDVPGHSRALTKPLPGFWLDCVEIVDPYGPTVTVESITALVVSAETQRGGEAVNEKRQEKGWPTLEVFEVDVLSVQKQDDDVNDTLQQGFASKISSTEIRRQLSATATASITTTGGAGPSRMTDRAVN